MKQASVHAMQRLEAASPLATAPPLAKWTTEDEDVLLAQILADQVAPSEESERRERRVARSGSRTRTDRITRPVLIAVTACAAGAAALGIALSTSGSPGAFAAWTARTTVPPAARLAAATSDCEALEKRAIDLVPNVSRGEAAISLGAWRLTDSRGPFEMLVYIGSSSDSVCLWDSGGVLSVTGGGGTLPAPTDRSVGIPTIGFARHRGSPVTYAYGKVGSEASAVTLTLTDGKRVQATVQNGLYAAWWPAQTDVASATVKSSSGVSHRHFGSVGLDNPAGSVG
jgi:hypothetical protein